MLETAPRPNKPEFKIGPFAGGISVEIWLNKTRDGRHFRAITIAPRRYKDQLGNWAESRSYRTIDLTALIIGLQKAQEFCTSTPLPDQTHEAEQTDF